MTKRIKVTSRGLPKIKVTSQVLERIDPDEFAKALGAERVEGVPESLLPPTNLNRNGRGTANGKQE